MSERSNDIDKILSEAKRLVQDVGTHNMEREPTEAMNRIFTPLFHPDYSKTTQEITEDRNRMAFRQIAMQQEDLNSLGWRINFLLEEGEKGDHTEIKNWRALDQLTYTIGEVEFRIFDLLPKGYKVLFCPAARERSGSMSWDDRMVFIDGDVASLGSLVVILHEVGHAIDREELQRGTRSRLTEGDQTNEANAAEKLRMEREANLFALRKLWPAIREDPSLKQDVLSYLKDYAYHSHCEGKLEELAITRAMAHHAGDYDLGDEDYPN